MSDSLWPHGLQHTRPSCPLSPRVCSDSCPLSWWCHLTISSSVIPFSFCLQSFPASRSFLRSQFFTSGGQRIVASASASLLPMNSRGWFLLGLIGLISLQFKGLSSVFSSTHNLNISKIILVVTCRSNKTTKPNQKINSQVLNHLDSGLWHCPGRQAPGEKKITICCFLKTSQPQVFGSEFSLWFSYGFALLPRLIISEVVTFKSF